MSQVSLKVQVAIFGENYSHPSHLSMEEAIVDFLDFLKLVRDTARAKFVNSGIVGNNPTFPLPQFGVATKDTLSSTIGQILAITSAASVSKDPKMTAEMMAWCQGSLSISLSVLLSFSTFHLLIGSTVLGDAPCGFDHCGPESVRNPLEEPRQGCLQRTHLAHPPKQATPLDVWQPSQSAEHLQ